MKSFILIKLTLLPPDHLVYDGGVGLDDLHHAGGDVLGDVVGDGRAVVAGVAHGHCGRDCLQERLRAYAGEHEARAVQRLGALSGRADADRRKGMSDRGEETALLRQCPTVRDHSECVHLQAIIVVESQRLVLDDTRIQPEATGFQALPAAWMAAV